MIVAHNYCVLMNAATQVESLPTREQNKEIALAVSKSIMKGDWDTLDSLLAALSARFANVEVMGRTSATRVVVNAWNPLAP